MSISALSGCSIADSVAVEDKQSELADSTFIYTCGGAPESQPAMLPLGCKSSKRHLEGLSWRGWGSTEAFADGRLVIYHCGANCEIAEAVVVPVQVMAWRRSFGEATIAYRRVNVIITGDVPAGEKKTRTYRFAG